MQQEIESSRYFDADWYSDHYRDVRLMGMSPAQHYLEIGASLLRDPGPEFSTGFYLSKHPDVAQAGVNPLWHYEVAGRMEGRAIAPAGEHMMPPLPNHPTPILEAEPLAERPVRVISFYLPQFHPIPENDEWWGEGFTEWTNVRKARPHLARHHQPHEPGELGYYDLRDIGVQRRQVELAKLYGVEGFCFYFYWFAGKTLLETPVRNYLDDSSLDLPFALCWANENWSRRWDGKDHDVLIAQEHSAEDDLAFIQHVAEYLRDPRYIRVDGKPMLLVYRPNLLPDPKATVARWRTWCRENGVGEIFLAYTQSFESVDPREYDFDAAAEFPPNNTGVPSITRFSRPDPDFAGNIYDWSALVERSFVDQPRPYTHFRGICPSWDNTARRGINGTILAHSTPRGFTRWATNAFRAAQTETDRRDERIVFVNAWNEWAEGAHLEPDAVYGYAWLESLRVAMACATKLRPLSRTAARVGAVIDAHEASNLTSILLQVRAASDPIKLFVRTTPDAAASVSGQLAASGLDYSLRIGSTDDHDRPAFLEWLPTLQEEGIDPVLNATASTNGQCPALDVDFVEHVIASMEADPDLGVVFPAGEREPSLRKGAVSELGARLGLSADEVDMHGRWRGRNFAARLAAVAPLGSIALTPDATGRGELRHETIAAAVYRSVSLSAVACGLRASGAGDATSADVRPGVVIVSHDAHPHGAQRLALHLATSYSALGFHVHTIVLGLGVLVERFQEVSTVHHVDLVGDPPSRTLRLLQALRANGASFALANTTVSGPLLPLLKQARLRTVSLIHELPQTLRDLDLIAQARSITKHADHVVFPAQLVRRGFEGFAGQPTPQSSIRPQGLYLHNPHRTDTDRHLVGQKIRNQLGLAPGSRILLCVGYADRRKGLDLFVRACISVMSTDPTAVAVWVGNMGDRRLLADAEADLRAAGMASRFTMTGLVENPEDFYAAADVFLLTSREDPFPSTVLEAMDADVHVVAFAGVSGSEELLERGAGTLVPAFDVEEMADAVRDVLSDPDHDQAVRTRARAIIAQEFAFQDYVYDLSELAGHHIPRVSVIVPNYNYAQYIGDRLQSIARQTAPVYELIVLDDASTDDSVGAIREALERIDIPSQLVVNESNSGSVFEQWRRGVDLARGDFIWIAEADDLADPTFLAEVVPALEDPAVVMSHSQSRQMDSNGALLSEDYLDYVSDVDPERWTRSYVAEGPDEIAAGLFVKNTVPNVSGSVFRRAGLLRVLHDHRQEIQSFKNAGDWVTYLRLLESGRLAFCAKSLNSHRRHPESVTVGNFNVRQLREIITVQRATIARHELGADAVARADAYAQRLYEQFGLADDQAPRFNQHPELREAQSPPPSDEEESI